MSKRRKRAVLIISIFIVIILFLSLASPQTVYKEVSDNGNFVVEIQTSDFLQAASMGGREYTLIINKKKLLKKQIFSETFWFNNDGSPITDNDINIDWNSESINITIDSEEMNAKSYTVYYN